MILKKELVKHIREHFNLNVYETKVWLALLSKGIASAGEIAEISEVPRSRTYDVLESLEKRGFAIVKIGKPVKYIAVKPVEVLEKMKSRTMEDAQEKIKSLSNVKELPEYQELEQLHLTGIAPVKPHEITGSIKGRANIISRTKELLESARKEVLICTSANDFIDKCRVLLPTLQKLAQKNIKVKIALSGEEDKVRKIKSKFKIKASRIDTPTRLFMADKSEVLFLTTPENADDERAVWLQSAFFTNSLNGIISSNIKGAK